jgi:hypothetical protein
VFCENCGNTINERDLFCPICGANQKRMIHENAHKSHIGTITAALLGGTLVLLVALIIILKMTLPSKTQKDNSPETPISAAVPQVPETSKKNPQPRSFQNTPDKNSEANRVPGKVSTIDTALSIAKANYPNFTDWSQGEWSEGVESEKCILFTAVSAKEQAIYAVFITETGGCYARYAGDLYYFIIPDSNIRYLTESDLLPLTKEELRLARNEIYARYGRMFNAEDLQRYFDSQIWYTPCIQPDDFQESTLTEIEKYNAHFIKQYEDNLK